MTPKPHRTSNRARVIHRYLGFFLSGIMAIYAVSGVLLIFRDTDFLKVEERFARTLAPGLDARALGEEIGNRRLRFERSEGDVDYFRNGSYDRVTGATAYVTKELPYVFNRMTHLHKANTKDPLFALNVAFGVGLLVFVVTAFWMYLPGGTVLRKGLWFALAGGLLALGMLFV